MDFVKFEFYNNPLYIMKNDSGEDCLNFGNRGYKTINLIIILSLRRILVIINFLFVFLNYKKKKIENFKFKPL